ncbi:MAG: hypothetical protein JST65_12240 [Acidobacteria bacterium]|nr:hypothetical protein [Acidobacteriota bacterium]
MNARAMKAAMQQARADLMRDGDEFTEDDVVSAATDIYNEWEADAAWERQEFGDHDDTPSLATCDDAGTGEGRYHGRM